MFNYKNQCPICKSKVINSLCSLESCFNEYEYAVRDDYVDFYLKDYIIEYDINKNGSHKKTYVSSRKNVKLILTLNIPFDFSIGIDKISEKIKNLQVFK